MDNATLIGLIAASLTTTAFLPQVIKIMKTKSTRDISLKMYVILALGVLLWLVYGFMIMSWPVIAANTTVLVLSIIIIVFKVKYD